MCEECLEQGGVHQERALEFKIGNPIDVDGALFQTFISDDGSDYNVVMRPMGIANEDQKKKALVYLTEMTKVVTDIISAFMARN